MSSSDGLNPFETGKLFKAKLTTEGLKTVKS